MVIGLVLWPIFIEGEPILPILLVTFLLAGAALIVIAIRSNKRWARYALVGIVPGIFIGGIGFWALVNFTGSDNNDGWQELIAVLAGVFGAFIGAVLGAVIGGFIGFMMDRNRHNA